MTPRRRAPVGFARGDFDPTFPLDDKVQRLRATLDPLRYHAAMSVYWHVVAAAWRKPERKPADQTCPEAPEQVADLIAVGLLDRKGRLPITSFEGWIGKAVASRESATERKRRERTGMSRVTSRDDHATERDPREGRTGEEGEERTESEGGSGGKALRPINPLLVRDDSLLTVTPLVNEAWIDATGLPSVLASPVRAQEILIDSCRRHPEGKVIDAIYSARELFPHIPEAIALAFAVKRILDPFVDPKLAAKAQAQAEEAARSRRGVENTLRTIHSSGGHTDRADPRCPMCAGRAA